MKARSLPFAAGFFACVLAIAAIHFIPWYRSPIPHWSRDEALKRRLVPVSEIGSKVLTWEEGRVATSCLDDFRKLGYGTGVLAAVYRTSDGRYTVILVHNEKTRFGEDISDSVLAYVWDHATKQIAGKFWMPMA